MAERLRQPLPVLLGHGGRLRARASGPVDPSIAESVATASEMEVYLRQFEAAHGLAERVHADGDPLLPGDVAAPPVADSAPAARVQARRAVLGRQNGSAHASLRDGGAEPAGPGEAGQRGR